LSGTSDHPTLKEETETSDEMTDRKPESTTASVGDDSTDQKTPYNVDAESRIDTSETAYVIDHHAERSLCRKFDFRLLPVLAIMYLFNALDKGNLGNAKSAKPGIEETLNFKSNQYNIILSVFYVPYVIFAPPIVRFIFPKARAPNSQALRECLGRSMGLTKFCLL